MIKIKIRVITFSILLASFSLNTLADDIILSSYNVDDESINSVTNSTWSETKVSNDFYDSPYEISLFDAKHGEDSERLWSQTQLIFGLGLGVAGFIAILPEDISNWHSSDETLREKWGNNLSAGPYWDRDKPYINYIGHPYFGGVYYQIARKSGYRQWDSFIYSAMMSTFYWELGVEAFAEVPSVQDLVVTPVGGWLVGEWMFQKEREIRESASAENPLQTWDNVALFFLDPVDSIGRGINSAFDSDFIKAGTGYISYDNQRGPNGAVGEKTLRLQVSFQFDASNKVADKGLRRNYYGAMYGFDPVDTSIIGVSIGTGYTNFDSEWLVDDGIMKSAGLGLYFSPKFSATLNYTTAHINDTVTGEEFTWENYNISGQYYFNTEEILRPYAVFGFGEMLKDQDNSTKTFQTHAGIGIHYKMSQKWAWETELILWHSSRFSRFESTLNSSMVYRFGRGG